RACLGENPTVFDAWNETSWFKYFQEATHMERLALMRNPEINSPHAEGLIQKIFDFGNQELGIDTEIKKELIFAFLTNQHALDRSKKLKASDFIDGWSMESTRAHFSLLWALIAQWPENNGGLKHAVYRYMGTTEETKAFIYQTCTDTFLRQTIL